MGKGAANTRSRRAVAEAATPIPKVRNMRRETIQNVANEIARQLKWLKPDDAASVCRMVYSVQQARIRKKLMEQYG